MSTRSVIEFFVLNLIDQPDVVKISEIESDGKLIFEIRVAPQDLAKLIGKEGSVFRALRSLANVIDKTKPADIVIDIVS